MSEVAGTFRTMRTPALSPNGMDPGGRTFLVEHAAAVLTLSFSRVQTFTPQDRFQEVSSGGMA